MKSYAGDAVHSLSRRCPLTRNEVRGAATVGVGVDAPSLPPMRYLRVRGRWSARGGSVPAEERAEQAGQAKVPRRRPRWEERRAPREHYFELAASTRVVLEHGLDAWISYPTQVGVIGEKHANSGDLLALPIQLTASPVMA